jgi:hypothetical protein
MERPAKRPRLALLSHEEEDADDELFLEPDEINARRDPDAQLERARTIADFKLKSTWEHIFRKYEKDFTGADDEIDMATGEVVVDNGHIRSLPDVDDGKSVAESESVDLEDEERILHGKGPGAIRPGPSLLMPYQPYGGRLSGLGSFSGLSSLAMRPPRLSTLFSTGLQFPSFRSLGSFNSLDPVEATWRAPELPAQAFDHRAVAKKAVTTRKVVVKSIATAGDDSSDDDDIIMGASSWRRERGKEKTQEESAVPKDVSPVQAPTATLQDSSSLVENGLRYATTSESSRIVQKTTGMELVTGRPRPTKRGRKPNGWKRNKFYSSAQKLSRRRSEPIVVSDSQEDLLDVSGVVATDVGISNSSMNVVSAVELRHELAKSRSRVEVHLVRRHRIGSPMIRAVLKAPLLASRPTGERKQTEHFSETQQSLPKPRQPLDNQLALVLGKKKSSEQKRRSLPLPPTSAPSKDPPDIGGEQTLPAALTTQLGSPAKSSPAKTHQEDKIPYDLQEQPMPEVPEHQSQPVTELVKRPAPLTERFSMNTIDRDYEFSDEDESWVLPRQAKNSLNPNNKPDSASRRRVVKRVPKPSWDLKSSPSIPAAYPTIKKGFLTPTAKPAEENSPGRKTTPKETSSDKISTPVGQLTPEVGKSVTKEQKPPEQSSHRTDEVSSSPFGATRNRTQSSHLPITPTSNHSKKELPPSPPVVTPSSRQSKSKPTTTPSVTRPSTSKRSIMSLISDTDEDELSLTLDQISPLASSNPGEQLSLFSRNRSAARKLAVKRTSVGSSTKPKPKQRRSTGWTSSFTPSTGNWISGGHVPGDVERTPGGTVRRCGEDGFRCERDFCFACL